MTILETAEKGEVLPVVKRAAELEGRDASFLVNRIAAGRVVVLASKKRRNIDRPCAVGEGLRTKVNANIGTSPEYDNIEEELKKLYVALQAGTDTIMDLSTGGDVDETRKRILEVSPVPVGTVPVYSALVSRGGVQELREGDFIEAVRRHAADGVDFMTIHCGVTREVMKHMKPGSRVCGVVSRGGSTIARWMKETGKENPLYARFDEILDIAREHDVTLSLGDGLRPGAIADALDVPQVAELEVLCELAAEAHRHGVQAMIEGPGHVPLHQIPTQVQMEKELSGGVPFYVLGPIVTDTAPGYDHITSAIGGAVASAAGADFLCYVTPAEHLGLPDEHHVREGVIAARIAAHAGDIAKDVPGARRRDEDFSTCRMRLDWEGMFSLSIDPERARRIRNERAPANDGEVCSMCGGFCVYRLNPAEGEGNASHPDH